MRHKQSLFSRKLEIKQSLFFASSQNKGIVGIFILVLVLIVAGAGGAYYLGTKGTFNLKQLSPKLTTKNDQELRKDSIYFLRNNIIWSIDPVSKREERLTPVIPYPTGQTPFYEISPDKKFAYIVEQSDNQSLYLKRYHLSEGRIDDLGKVGYRYPESDDRGVGGWITHLAPTGKRILIESWPGHLAERVETVWDIVDGTARKILDISELKLDPKKGLIFKGWVSDKEFIIQLYDPPRSIVYRVNITDKSAQRLFEVDDLEFDFNEQTKEIIATVLNGETYTVKIFDLNGAQKADLYQARKTSTLGAYPIIISSFIPNSDLILIHKIDGSGGEEYYVFKRSTEEVLRTLPLVPGHIIGEFSPDFSKGLAVESGQSACNIRIFDIYSGVSDILIKDGCQEVRQIKWIK